MRPGMMTRPLQSTLAVFDRPRPPATVLLPLRSSIAAIRPPSIRTSASSTRRSAFIVTTRAPARRRELDGGLDEGPGTAGIYSQGGASTGGAFPRERVAN